MDGNGPYERYYTERAAAGRRGVWLPLAFLAVVAPLLLVRALVVDGEQAAAVARVEPTAVAAPATAGGGVPPVGDGVHPVGDAGLRPGLWVTRGPVGGLTCAYVRTGPDGREVARAVLRGPGAEHLAAGEHVALSGGCTWSAR